MHFKIIMHKITIYFLLNYLFNKYIYIFMMTNGAQDNMIKTQTHTNLYYSKNNITHLYNNIFIRTMFQKNCAHPFGTSPLFNITQPFKDFFP
uniref:Uncharacterized protein n=1 Tax=Lepeophtheirus salmonis TaxID=72036 RepID=A0A0K2T448_LEPSM